MSRPTRAELAAEVEALRRERDDLRRRLEAMERAAGWQSDALAIAHEALKQLATKDKPA